MDAGALEVSDPHTEDSQFTQLVKRISTKGVILLFVESSELQETRPLDTSTIVHCDRRPSN